LRKSEKNYLGLENKKCEATIEAEMEKVGDIKQCFGGMVISNVFAQVYLF